MSLAIFKDLQNGEIPKRLKPKTTSGRLIKVLLKAVDTTNEIIIITDAPENIGNEEILFVNNAFEECTQYSKKEAIGRTPSFLQGPATNDEVIGELVDTLENGESFEGETFNYRKDGSKYRVRWSIQPIRNKEDDITHFVSVQRDVTEEWKKRKKLTKMVEERETLLKETHHRIKNNLATITGLLELQILESESERVQEILSESMNRVQSIASIHEKLYQSTGFTSININSYLKDLIEHMKESSSKLGLLSGVDIIYDLGDITIATKQAISLGLIINELVTNANKHAFEDEEGTITITCEKKDDQIHLHFKDNGKGFPQNIKIKELKSLGMKLIENLCDQLNADYHFYNNDGANFEMYFKGIHS